MNNRFARAAMAAATAFGLVLTGCSSSSGDDATQSSSSNVIDYWLWDSAQQPGYQKCADAFAQQNPGLKVNITQIGWDDYWTKLTAGFIADEAPDVFTNHLSKYAQFVDLGVLLPLDDLGPTSGITSSDYQEGLGDLWVGQDGKRYGAPKDWDTIAYFYDTKVTEKAGITKAQLDSMTWNPDDGGTFEDVISHLTLDTKGVRGDEPGFDKNHVAVYGLASDGSGGENFGQTQWGAYTATLGWNATDKNPWGTHFNLDDANFQKAIDWYYGLAQKGYMPKYSTFGKSSGSYAQFAAGKAALAMNGSWMISSFASLEDVDLEIAPTPVGPSGDRSSPFNGLADSITKFTDNADGSAKWVAYMASDACQNVIGESGVVFPARPAGTARSVAVRKEAGIDVTPFTVHITDGTTKLLNVVNNAADLAALTGPEFDAIYIGSKKASDLTELNGQINKLFEYASK
ncbi:MAG TPA: sugar ABC transporter substrate-binding protein [Candidatus Luteococcus avicola]|nr:sugar ABC transporter substrate-binding protein [Candidatus Luteococcus avicola]